MFEWSSYLQQHSTCKITLPSVLRNHQKRVSVTYSSVS
jgi:hypothetical protein